MTDLTYREAVNARFAQLCQGPSAEHGERAWGEGETERMAAFLNRSISNVVAGLLDAFRSACRAITDMFTAMQEMFAALASVDGRIEQEIHNRVVASRVRPSRSLPGRELQPSFHDQRPAIRQYYARMAG